MNKGMKGARVVMGGRVVTAVMVVLVAAVIVSMQKLCVGK